MKIMAVDFGDARTGLAVCDRTEFLASPVGTILEHNFDACVEKTALAAQEYDVGEIVVGLPRNMDGSEGSRAKKCQEFAEKLRALVSVPVVMWDERRTTLSAANYLNETNVRGKKRKEIIDEVAATIILEDYLAYRKNTARKAGES